MKSVIQWAAFIGVILVLYFMDLKHMAASQYNTFLLILLGMITGLILILKGTSQQKHNE